MITHEIVNTIISFLGDGREALLKINLREVKIETNVNLKEIAKRLDGYSGADITNVCRYGILVAWYKYWSFSTLFDITCKWIDKRSRMFSDRLKFGSRV